MSPSSAPASTAPASRRPRPPPATRCCCSSRPIAAGTSSRSSKLIHGGLRYLETGQYPPGAREPARARADAAAGARAWCSCSASSFRCTRTRAGAPGSCGSACRCMRCWRTQPEARFGTLPRREWDRLDGLDTHESAGGVLLPGRPDRRSRADPRGAALGAAAWVRSCSVRRTFEAASLAEDGVELQLQRRRARRSNAAHAC